MRLLIAGGICGLAWACGLRGFMAQVAGPQSEVTWSWTFGWILNPRSRRRVAVGMGLSPPTDRWAQRMALAGPGPADSAQ